MTPQYTIMGNSIEGDYIVALATSGPYMIGHGATIEDAKRDARRQAQDAGLWDYAQEEHESESQ